jgi:hypothetical protein
MVEMYSWRVSAAKKKTFYVILIDFLFIMFSMMMFLLSLWRHNWQTERIFTREKVLENFTFNFKN